MTTEKYMLIMDTIETATTANRMAKIADRVSELVVSGECNSDEHRYIMNRVRATMDRKGIPFNSYVECFQQIRNKKLWTLVNAANTLESIEAAKEEVKALCSDNELYDELMMTLSYKAREAYRN